MPTPNMIPIAVVLPDGREHYDQMRWPADYASRPEQKCQDALRALKIETHRNDPQPVKCKLFHLTYKNGQPYRQLLSEHNVMPQLTRMTEEEFAKEISVILCELPREFRGCVSMISWDRGHSSGHEEVISIARDIANELKPCIEGYRKSLFHGAEDGMVTLPQ